MKTISMPLLLSTRTLQNYIGQTKTELEKASIEATLGRASNLVQHMRGDTGAVHRLDKLVLDAERRIASTTLLQQEAANVQNALGSIRDVVLDFGGRIEGAVGVSDTATLNMLEIETEAQIEAIWGRLNTSFNGDYQFSGAATDTQPLGDLTTFLNDIETIITGATSAAAVDTALDAYFDDTVAGAFHTTVYQGSTNDAPDRQVSESRRLGVDAKATDVGVRNALRGLALFSLADSATTSSLATDLKSDAAATLNNAGMQIIQKQTLIGAVEEDATLTLAENEVEKATYELLVIEEIGVDQYEAAALSTLLETQLQAIYLATSRISNLSLANYL